MTGELDVSFSSLSFPKVNNSGVLRMSFVHSVVFKAMRNTITL